MDFSTVQDVIVMFYITIGIMLSVAVTICIEADIKQCRGGK